MIRGIAAAVLLLAVVVLAWTSRVSEGRSAIAACDAAIARSDHAEAIMAARTAAEARCPALCSSELGYARLYAIAKDAEKRADDATAFAAWHAVRSAALATTAIDSHPARRERADVELARLGHRLEPGAEEERLAEAASRAGVPGGVVYLLLAVGGGFFLFGAARFAKARSLSRIDLALAVAGVAVATAGVLFF